MRGEHIIEKFNNDVLSILNSFVDFIIEPIISPE